MLRNILIGAGVVGLGVWGYRELKKRGKLPAMLSPGKEPAQFSIVPVARPGAEIKPRRISIPKSSRVREGAQRVPVSSSVVRKGATLTRPVTLAECCDALCLPTLERETRSWPPFEHRVSANRNLWANYQN